MPNASDIAISSTVETPLYDRIVRVVGAEIARGRIQPGTRLMESRLASRFGVSRAPARQALAEMAALGLLVHADAPARGYLVVADAVDRSAEFADGPTEPFNGAVTPTWQLIYGDVEAALTRRVAFGSWRLVEAGLGQHFGVSRTVAREVLARLQSRGLVVNEGKRWIAPEFTATRVRELYGLRAVLEPAALVDVASLAMPDRLDQMLDDLRAAMRTGPEDADLDTLEADLHFEVLGRCRNTLLRKTMVESQSLLLVHRFFYTLTAKMYPVEPFLAEHAQILEALRRGQVTDAADALRLHLLASSDRAVARIDMIRDTYRDDPPDYLDAIETPTPSTR